MWFPFLSGRPSPGPSRRVRCPLSVEPLEGRALMCGFGGDFDPDPPAPPPAAEEAVVAPEPSPAEPPPAEETLEAPPLPEPDPIELG